MFGIIYYRYNKWYQTYMHNIMHIINDTKLIYTTLIFYYAYYIYIYIIKSQNQIPVKWNVSEPQILVPISSHSF